MADENEVLVGHLVLPNADISRISFNNPDEIVYNEKRIYKDLNSSNSNCESNNLSGSNLTSTAYASHLSGPEGSSLYKIK